MRFALLLAFGLSVGIAGAQDEAVEGTDQADETIRLVTNQLDEREKILAQQFNEAVAELKQKYLKELAQRRKEAKARLKSAMDRATEAGRIDNTLKLRIASREIDRRSGNAPEAGNVPKADADPPQPVGTSAGPQGPAIIDLLKLCRDAAAKHDNWQVTGNALIAKNLRKESWLTAPAEAPGDYDLLITLKKLKLNGPNDSHIVIPFEGRAATLVVRHAILGQGIGFFTKDLGKKVYDPPAGWRMRDATFVSKASTLLIRVQGPTITVWVDGQEAIRLSHPNLNSREKGVFKLGSWKNETIFTRYLLGPVGSF